MSMIICDNCGIHADSDYGNCVFGDVHSFCSEECCIEFNNNNCVFDDVHSYCSEECYEEFNNNKEE